MDMIPEYIKRRDDKSLAWKKGVDDRITNLLSETYNVIVYQEQLQAMWIRLAGFTVPEAEAHRKVISKKWKDKLPLVEKQWKTGAAKTIGQDEADKWWGLMVEFGRYAFNRAHSVAYSLITYWCLYLKAHYPAEWWAAAMAGCHKDKLKSYMGAAKLEGVVFGGLDVNKLTYAFAVIDDKVVIGLQAVKGVGEKASGELCSLKGPFTNVDEMVGQLGKKKGIFERLIKLGAFDKLHPSRKGLWMWYQYKYCSGPEFTELRKEIDSKIMPPESDLEKIRAEKIEEFSRLYPKRKKIPKTLLEWKPKIGHRSPVPSRDQVIDLYDDYTLKEKLGIEKDILGYYWTSPRGMFRIQSGTTLEDAKVKKTNCRIEVVIEDVVRKISKNKNPFYILSVTDGIQEADITIWESTVNSHKNLFHPGQGIIMNVDYSPDRNNFKISKDNSVRILQKTDVPIDTTNQDVFQKYEEKEDDFPYI
jgi:DNA polymerase III alpha subunit